MLYHKYKPLASRVYCTGLALLLVLAQDLTSTLQVTMASGRGRVRVGLRV